jgi:hypothetical protein
MVSDKTNGAMYAVKLPIRVHVGCFYKAHHNQHQNGRNRQPLAEPISSELERWSHWCAGTNVAETWMQAVAFGIYYDLQLR